VVAPVTATRVVTASDPDNEVRCVVRLLAEHLGAAGITANGAAVGPVIERAFPRTLLGLLALPDHG